MMKNKGKRYYEIKNINTLSFRDLTLNKLN